MFLLTVRYSMLVVRVKGYQKFSTWLTAYLLLVVLAVLTFLVVNGLGDGSTLFMVRGKGFRLVEEVWCVLISDGVM